MHRIWNKIIFLFTRSRIYSELEEEMETHREIKQKELEAAGMEPEEARAAARRDMGNATVFREESGDMWKFLAFETVWQDLRYAIRVIAKSPVFTTVAVLSLAIGIGGNAAMFSVVNRLLIRPLPFSEPDRLLRITGVYPKAGLIAFQQRARSMDAASFTSNAEFNLTGQGEAMRVTGVMTSANFFQVLGAGVERGRVFHAGEDRPGRDHAVIISQALWRSKFGGDPDIIGRSILLDGVPREVIGMMAPGFSFPSAKTQLWMPTRIDPAVSDDYWGSEFTALIARLRPGATMAQARSEVAPLVTHIRAGFPFPMHRDWNATSTAISLQQDLVGNIREKLLILLAAVGIVLLIACANVASLLLSRATTRRKEMALRAALGAGRFRIVRQLLTESVLLAILGGVAGVLLGSAALSVFRSVLPADTAGLASVQIDWPVVGFVACLTVAAGLAFGIAPALSASQTELAHSVKTGTQRTAAAFWIKFRSSLIATEIALTVVLVMGSGLLLKSLYRLSQVNPGFQAAQLLMIRISPNESFCKNRAACVALYDELLKQARGVSGVSQAALTNSAPLDGQLPLIAVDVQDHPKTADNPAPMFWTGAITPAYLHMLQIPLLDGRGFTESDGMNSAPVILISASTAKRYWPGQSAIGKHVKATMEQQWRTVVGVVGDVHQYSLGENSLGWIGGAEYMPYAQAISANQQIPAAMDLVVKSPQDGQGVASEIRRLAVDRNPNVPVGRVQVLSEFVSGSISEFRSTMWVFVSFGVAALLLAAVGIYGLISYSTAQRTYEIGVRMALGATKGGIVRLVMAQGFKLTLYGLAGGVLASLALTRVLTSLLYDVGASDPVTFAMVFLLLVSVALSASFVPAMRAARIEPVLSLRAE